MNLPKPLQLFIDDFAVLSPEDRLELLVELGEELPELPPELVAQPDLMERVVECQSPVAILASVDDTVTVHARVAREAAATRGFAAIVVLGLNGTTPAASLAVPTTLPSLLGLEPVVSRLRLQGMSALLQRVQRQISASEG